MSLKSGGLPILQPQLAVIGTADHLTHLHVYASLEGKKKSLIKMRERAPAAGETPTGSKQC